MIAFCGFKNEVHGVLWIHAALAWRYCLCFLQFSEYHNNRHRFICLNLLVGRLKCYSWVNISNESISPAAMSRRACRPSKS